MAAVTRRIATAEIAAEFRKATIPHAAINDIPAVREMAAVKSHLTITRAPDGRPIRMQPLAVELDASRVEAQDQAFAFDTVEGDVEVGHGLSRIDCCVNAPMLL